MGTYLSLGGFELFLFMVLLKKVMRADFFRAGIISICIVNMQVLMTPVPVEAFFWFCEAALYTVTYNEMVILLTLLILLYYNHGPTICGKRILL